MKSPAFGIAYLLWLKLRWILITALILVSIFAVTIRIVPASAPYCQFACVMLFFAALLPLFNACTLGPADLGARTSGFPSHMFVLPLSNHSLVVWPMLFGAIIFGGLWMLVAFFVFIPTDLPLPVVWPAMMLVAISIWLQAIAWSPFPSPFIRVPALVITVAPLILVPLVTRLGMPPKDGMVPALLVWCFAWSLVAYLFGIRGLTRARTGREGDWYRAAINYIAEFSARRLTATHSACTPFRSAAAAQLWHEFRRNTVTMPIMVAIVGVPLLAVFCQATIVGRDSAGFAVSSFTVSTALLTLMVWIGLPLMIATVSGAGFAKFDVWGKDEMPSFFAIRPMTSFQFVGIKLAAIGLATLTTCILSLAMFAAWAVIDVSPFNSRESLVRVALDEATPRSVAATCAVLLGLAAVMYRNTVTGMWSSLFGRKWVTFAVSMCSFALFSVVLLAAQWVYKHPEIQGRVRDSVPWIVALLLSAKVCCLVAVGLGLRRWYGFTLRQLTTLYATWIFVAGLILAVISCFVSPTWMMAAGVTLFVPFSRLAVMPRSLELNRCR